MVDRQKLEALLAKRFPGAAIGQIAAAANGIIGMDDEWEEIVDQGQWRVTEAEADWRVFRRRSYRRS